MKKLIYILSALAFATIFIFTLGCNKDFGLSEYVTELRKDVFACDNSDFNLTASYGYKVSPLTKDSKTDKRIYALVFRLIHEETSSVEFCVAVNINGQEKSATFSLDPVSHKMTAFILVDENFNLKEFPVTLKSAGKSTNITMKSILPKNTIDYKTALNKLYENNKNLIDTYMENGVFNGKIIQRVIVKNDKPYWYIGLIDNSNDLKALLIDGITGQTLAIRHVF